MAILFLVVGVLAVYLLQRILYTRLWKKGLSLTVKFRERSAVEGDDSTLAEVLENRNFLPLLFLHAKFNLNSGLVFDGEDNVSSSDRHYKNDVFSVLFYQKITRVLRFHCKNRGYYRITEADLVSSDLFYTAHMAAILPQRTEFYVYPKQADISSLETPLRKLLGDTVSKQYLYPDPFQFRGIRSYTLSDPMNTINWKASARANELMVNMYDSTTTKKIVIFLNLEDETVIHHTEIHEESIRIAAGLAVKLLSEGVPVRIISNARDIETLQVSAPMELHGTSEVQDVFRYLSRLDHTQETEEFYPYINREMQEDGFSRAGYIMISQSMKPALQEQFLKLSQSAYAFWVLPLFKNMKSHMELPEEVPCMRWEVKGHA